MPSSSPAAPPRARPFQQVDVFTAEAGLGNPLAVVVDGDGLSNAQMQRFAGWTNLSETTFLLPPTTPACSPPMAAWRRPVSMPPAWA